MSEDEKRTEKRKEIPPWNRPLKASVLRTYAAVVRDGSGRTTELAAACIAVVRRLPKADRYRLEVEAVAHVLAEHFDLAWDQDGQIHLTVPEKGDPH